MQNDRDAAPLHGAVHRGANVIVKGAEDLRAAVQQRCLHAEASHDAREFDRHVAGADDDDALRQFVQVEHRLRCDGVLHPRHVRRPVGVSPGRDEYVACFVDLTAAGESDPAVTLKDGTVFDDGDPGGVQATDIGAVQATDLRVEIRAKLGPIEGGFTDGPSETDTVLELIAKPGRVDHQLLRDASANDARPADAIGFGERHFRPVTGGNPRGPYAARTASDDEEIKVSQGTCLVTRRCLVAV